MEIPSGYAQANLIFGGLCLPTGAEVTLGFNIGTFSGDIDDVAAAIIASYSSAGLESLQVEAASLEGVLVKFGPNATGPSVLAPANVTGTNGDNGDWPATCLLVHKNTDFGGRAGRGRMYWPGIPETKVSSTGEILAAFVTSSQTVFNDWFADLNTADLEPVLLHGAGSPLSTPSILSGFSVDARVASQRRRNRR